MRGPHAEDFQCPFCGVSINKATTGLVALHFYNVHGIITKDRDGVRSLLIKLHVVDIPIGKILGEWTIAAFVLGVARVVRRSDKFILFQQGKKCKVNGS